LAAIVGRRQRFVLPHNSWINREAQSRILLALAEMVSHRCYELFNRNVKYLADSQQREDRDGATCLHHLPMAGTEPIGDHVLLAQSARGPASPDFLTQPAKKPAVMNGNFSGSSHTFQARLLRAKTPRAKRLDSW
jgi:hypothetical protein